jgi:iron complex outermembrane receptor protein
MDLDGTPLSIFSYYSVWDQEQYSQEFQLSGSWGDKLDWITGLYYFEESSSELSVSRFGGILGDLFAPGIPLELVGAPVNAGSDGIFDNTSKGIFAQANYQFTEKLRGTLGIRYTKDTRDVLLRPEAPESGQIGAIPPGNCVLMVDARDHPEICRKTDTVDFDYPAWVFGLDYQVNESLFVYAKTSGASMSGGWNIRATRVPAFEPEDAMDLELGFKSDLFDDTVRFNGAFFYIKYDGQQRFVNEFDPIVNSATSYSRNAGKSHAYGAELELIWLPWDGMTISSSLAMLETEYDDYEVLESIVSGANAGQQVLVDHSGKNAPQAPKMTFNIAATQMFDTSLGEIELHADYYWVDETWFADTTPRPGESAALIAQLEEERRWQSVPDYGLFNARATLRTNDGAWEFSLWGKNLGDEEYYTGVGNFYTGFGTAMWFTGDPRIFGASAKYSW